MQPNTYVYLCVRKIIKLTCFTTSKFLVLLLLLLLLPFARHSWYPEFNLKTFLFFFFIIFPCFHGNCFLLLFFELIELNEKGLNILNEMENVCEFLLVVNKLRDGFEIVFTFYIYFFQLWAFHLFFFYEFHTFMLSQTS